MAKLSDKVKVAIDETRMLILGAQILVGFQFTAVFEDGFERLSPEARHLNGVGLGLMVLTVALLIAPGVFHRIVERGEDSGRLHRFTSTMAGAALFPFACSVGLDLFIAIEKVAGFTVAILVGGAFSAMALFFWYGLELLRMRRIGRKERSMAAQESGDGKPTSLHVRIEQMLTEARVILPGAQALLGFQLIIAVTRSFEKLPELSKLLHGISLGLVTFAVILLMTPAAYHRLVYRGEDSEEFHRTGSVLVTTATLPLALGLNCDLYVVGEQIFSSRAAAVSIAVGSAIVFTVLWYVYPVAVRIWSRKAPAEL